MTKYHSLVGTGSRHALHDLEYPTQADLAAGTNEINGLPANAQRILRLARVQEDSTFYFLMDDDPLTWLKLLTQDDIDTVTLDVAYHNAGGTAGIAVDAGSVTWTLDSTYDFAIDLTDTATGTRGFLVEETDSGDYVRMETESETGNYINWTADVRQIDFTTNQYIKLDTAGYYIALQSDTPANPTLIGTATAGGDLGNLVIQATSADGSTYGTVWKDSGAATVATMNSDGELAAKTAKLSDLTDGYLPYHVSDVAGLANSGVYWSSGDSALGIGTTDFTGTPPIGTLVVKGSTADGSTNCLVLRDSGEANVLWVDTNGGIHTDQWLGQDSNTFIGVNVAGAGNLAHTAGDEGYYNTAIGSLAINDVTTGNGIVAIGRESATNVTTGNRLVAIGFQSLFLNTIGTSCNAVGYQSLYSNVDGENNNGYGYQALYSNVNGNSNVAFGYQALYSSINKNYNCAFGMRSLRYITGQYNIAFGAQAGAGSSGASAINNNVILGHYAGFALITGADNNTLVGYNSGDNISSGASNIIIGASCGAPSATGSNQLNIGNTIYGDLSNKYVGIGTYDFDGTPAVGTLIVKGSSNDGSTNGLVLRDSDEANVLWVDTNGGIHTDQWLNQDSNTFIGVGVAGNGALAHSAGNDGYFNTGLGGETLYSNSTGYGNSGSGYQSIYSNTTSDYNSAHGYRSLYYITGGSNTALGAYSGYGVSGSSAVANNVCVGYYAGFALQTGADGNTLLGYSAGDNITTGAGNIIIGVGIDAPSATVDDQLNIGNALFGDLSVGNLGVGAMPLTNMAAGDLLLEGGSLVLKEITTPTADANYGKVYTKSDNKLYFQDGAGSEHEIAFA